MTLGPEVVADIDSPFYITAMSVSPLWFTVKHQITTLSFSSLVSSNLFSFLERGFACCPLVWEALVLPPPLWSAIMKWTRRRKQLANYFM